MLRYSFDLDKEAQAIEDAVKQVLKEGYRTIDIMPQPGETTEGITQVGTAQMGISSQNVCSCMTYNRL